MLCAVSSNLRNATEKGQQIIEVEDVVYVCGEQWIKRKVHQMERRHTQQLERA